MAIRIGANIVGSTYNEQGRALKRMIEETSDLGPVEVLTTDLTSPGGMAQLEAGEIDMGLTAANWVPRAKNGEPPFAAWTDIRMVAPVNVGAPFFMVRTDSPLRTFDDLRGRRIAMGPKDGGQHNHVINIVRSLGLGMDGIEPVFIEFDEASDAVLAGAVDAIWQIPVPNRIVSELTARQPMRIIEYGPGQLAKLLADFLLYRRAVVPAGAFPGQETNTEQIGVLNVCVTHGRAEDDLIHGFVSAMLRETDMLANLHHVYRRLGDLIGEIRTYGLTVFEPGGIPMHPGAVRAYKDAGLLT